MQHPADSRNIEILEKIPCFSSFHQIVSNFESKMFILKGYTKFFNSVQQKLGNHQCKFALTHHTIKHPNKFTPRPPINTSNHTKHATRIALKLKTENCLNCLTDSRKDICKYISLRNLPISFLILSQLTKIFLTILFQSIFC